jgi:hypothetical protein
MVSLFWQAPAQEQNRYRIFLHWRTYTGVRPTPVTHNDLQQLLHEFRSKRIDEKYDQEDVVAPTSRPHIVSSGATMPSPPPSRPISIAIPTPPMTPRAQALRSQESCELDGSASPTPPPRPVSVVRPKSVAVPKVAMATVLYDCPASMEGTLAIFAGETVVIVDNSAAEWWAVKNSEEQTGWAPAAYLQMCAK